MKASNPIPEFIFFRKPRNHFRGFGRDERSDHQSIAATLITRAKIQSAFALWPATACERLAEDAAQTTLMVAEFQRWYREQREMYGNAR